MGAYPGYLAGQVWFAPLVTHYLGVPEPGHLPSTPQSVIGLAWGIGIGLAITTIGGWVFVQGLNVLLARSSTCSTSVFDFVTNAYTRIVGLLLKVSLLVLAVYGGLLFLTYWSFTNTPTGFIPSQDKGYLLVNVQLPDGASSERTQEVMRAIETLAKETKGVKHTVPSPGNRCCSTPTRPTSEPCTSCWTISTSGRVADLTSTQLAAELEKLFQAHVSDGLINVFEAPPVEGLGTAGGFKIVIEDRGELGRDVLQKITDKIVVRTTTSVRDLQGLYTSYRANTPWMFIDIDRQQAKTMGVSMGEVLNSLQVYPGSLYVNDINKFGRTWQVNVQGEAKFPQPDRGPQADQVPQRAGTDGAAGSVHQDA